MPTSSLYRTTEQVFVLQGESLSDWLLECRLNGVGWDSMLKMLEARGIHIAKHTLKRWARAVVAQQQAA